MSGDDTQRILGAHDADIETLKKSMADIATDVKAIRSTIDEGRGGWKAIVFIAGIAGTLGGFVGWAVSLMQHKPDALP